MTNPRGGTISVRMIRLTPILAAVLVGLAFYWFSSWRMTRSLAAQSTRLRNDQLEARIRLLAQELDLPQIPVRIYETEMVNGLASPDGKVFITRGFFEKFRRGEVTADELASVVAHELGHVALGHSRRRMIDFVGTHALRTILMFVIGRFIPFVGVYLANAVAQLIGARLSRSDEFEADAYAAALLTKSGIGVAPQISMFEKLGSMGQAAQMPAWFMSHPKTEERIAAIRRLDDAWRVSQ